MRRSHAPSTWASSSPRAGFTLIELLVTCVIVGALASIALPQLSRQRENAKIATLESDLHNLIAAQELYFADAGEYATDVTALDYRSSPGVDVTIDEGSGGGWSASATWGPATTVCTIWIGNVSAPAGSEGVPDCP